jgi:hypothetical protein
VAIRWLGMGDKLVPPVRRGCRLGRCILAKAGGLYAGVAAPDIGVEAMWSAGSLLVQHAAGVRVVRRRSSIATGVMS